MHIKILFLGFTFIIIERMHKVYRYVAFNKKYFGCMKQHLVFHNRYEFTISPNPIIFFKLLHLMHLAHYNFVIYEGFLSHASTFPKFQSFFGRGIKLQSTSNAL